MFTHDHLDHYDPETAPVYFAKEKNMTVLCPTSVWNKARQYKNGHNYVQFNRYSEWTEGDLRFSAVKAEHSDPYAIGFIIEELCSGEKVWLTGDTLYSKALLDGIPGGTAYNGKAAVFDKAGNKAEIDVANGKFEITVPAYSSGTEITTSSIGSKVLPDSSFLKITSGLETASS